MRRRLAGLLALMFLLTGCARQPRLLLDAEVTGGSDVTWVRGDSCVAVSLMGRGVTILDAATGAVRAEWRAEALPSHAVHGLAASATGETLAVATEDSVRVLLAREARMVRVVPGGGRTLALSNDGTRLAWSDGGTGRILDVATGRVDAEHVMTVDRGGLVWLPRVQRFAWVDGPRVQLANLDSLTANTLDVFTVQPLGPLAASGGGGTLAVAEDAQAISVWDVPRRTLRWRLTLAGEPRFSRMALSADTWYLATVHQGEVRVRWAYTGRPVTTWEPDDGAEVRDLAFARSGHRLATVAADGRVRIWELPASDKEQR